MLRALQQIVYFDGRFVAPHEAGEARISVLDAGYLTGDGVFATMRGYDGRCFRAERHLAELARGANVLGIPLSASESELAGLADEAARRTGATDAYVRVTLTRGPLLSIIARPMTLPSPDAYDHGVAAVIVSGRRIPPACIDPTIKTTSYAAQLLARREAEARGAFEGIQLAIDGSLACGAMANLFLVRGGELLTPSLESGCRAGITRGALLELAPSVGLRPIEGPLDPALLWEADEAFFTNTRIECLPIATVDGRSIRQQRHHALRKAFHALVRA
jgi:branched-chain amino acid aminotransferase